VSDPRREPDDKGKKDDQYTNLAKRLRESGYLAELRIGRTLANAGWQVEHV